MKIVQAMVAKGYGGAERYFVDLTNYLAEKGHEVLAVTHKDFRGRRQLIQHDNLEVASFNVLGWWDVRSRLAIQKEIKLFNAELMHAHLARASYFCGHISKNLNIPLTVKTHNYIDLKYYRNVDMFIPTTFDQRRYLMEQGIEEDRIQVIPNFSKITPLDQINTFEQGKPLVFYAIGRMVKKKGFDVLLRAFAKLIDAGYKAQIEIAGDGPEFAELERLRNQLGISQEVSFVGWVDNIKTFLQNKDAFILPSLDEPFGIVVLEAMALGKPIISTRTQGPKEILDSETACLIDVNSEKELTEAMVCFINEGDYRYNLASQALTKFKQNYAQDIVVPKILDLYKRLGS